MVVDYSLKVGTYHDSFKIKIIKTKFQNMSIGIIKRSNMKSV